MKIYIVVLMTSVLSACQINKSPKTDAPVCPVAKVNAISLEGPLRNLVFAKPENHNLKERYEAQQSKQQAWAMEMMKTYQSAEKDGKIEVDLNKQMQRTPEMEQQNLLRETVKGLVRKELSGVVETVFGDTYTVVIEQNYGDNIIHAKCQVPDITNDLREYLVRKSSPEK